MLRIIRLHYQQRLVRGSEPRFFQLRKIFPKLRLGNPETNYETKTRLAATRALTMTSAQHVYEIRPRKKRRGIDLISDRLPFGVLRFEGPEAIVDAVNYAKFYSRSH